MSAARAPLSGDEIRRAVGTVRRDGGLDADAWFETVALDESAAEAAAAERPKARLAHPGPLPSATASLTLI